MKQNREQRRKDAKAAATPTSCTQRIAHICGRSTCARPMPSMPRWRPDAKRRGDTRINTAGRDDKGDENTVGATAENGYAGGRK